MTLRWKLFLFLLAFSLLPLAVVTGIHRHGTRHVGAVIADGISGGLSEIVATELTQTAKDYAVVMGRSKNALEFALDTLAREAASALARERGTSGGGILPAETFGPPGPLDTPSPDQAARPAPEKGPSSPGTDARAASWVAPPGTSVEAGAASARALEPLVPLFQDMSARFSDAVYSCGVALEDGVFVAYPGRGGFPGGFDVRRQDWYLAAAGAFARGEDRVEWSGPVPDPVSGREVYTLSRPFAGPHGGLAGVAAVKVPLPRVLQESEISSQWSKALRSFLVADVDIPGGGKGLWIWAGSGEDWKGGVGDAGLPVDPENPRHWLVSEDAERFSAFVEAMGKKKSGSTVMSYRGEECFWAYARPFEDLLFVLVLPTSVVAPYADEARRDVADAAGHLLATAGTASVVVLLAVALGALFGSKAVTTPLDMMIAAWKRVAAGDFSVRLDFRTRDERADLARAFNETMPKLADHLRLRESLELAQEVQRNLLPRTPPSLPGLDVAGINLSCDETGGDYFDYFPLAKKEGPVLAAVIGDVTGHGVPSALLMATARALLRASRPGCDAAAGVPRPAERITEANRLLAEDVGESGRFMTLFWAEIDPRTGDMRWVRAGHDPAWIIAPDGEAPQELWGEGVPLGIIPDHVYRDYTGRLDPGRVLLMGTDGIWEARDPSGAMYGKARFFAVARENAARSAADLRDAVLADLAAFKAGNPMEDDVTLVVVKRT
ncbi:SpoIIE family protein phosphatase [Desulfolutivibrio sulfoxidireducens]|uniref:SpoIIE family protein phosphatase n=1 Tax=Desulfolutivibrio sulfoxidireducens TaxID=2773299 RepID=UPI00159E2319|nr:SpoIIE family protein phosphatase [Desulfolutivibrio sulfoxidireducens]QLA17873.1 SpoIIE family protein phosphatase [Desulfolutivibrio sulfoxidireducens]QLA21453.1 SpoIIE family protein phosphatase [Desulfolutivibrio sulfoxidireducens]